MGLCTHPKSIESIRFTETAAAAATAAASSRTRRCPRTLFRERNSQQQQPQRQRQRQQQQQENLQSQALLANAGSRRQHQPQQQQQQQAAAPGVAQKRRFKKGKASSSSSSSGSNEQRRQPNCVGLPSCSTPAQVEAYPLTDSIRSSSFLSLPAKKGSPLIFAKETKDLQDSSFLFLRRKGRAQALKRLNSFPLSTRKASRADRAYELSPSKGDSSEQTL